MNGIINVYKEAGYTSHDVVARLRRILHQKRIGHTGTLDPAARGVLPICVGRSTILSDIVADGEKKYETVLLLGTVTDTYDCEGNILRTAEVSCSEEEAAACVKSFIGEQDQIPPMYSAVKVGGKKLYELARKGIEVERKPRRITIHDIVIRDISLPEMTLEITCSKGTYIRTLCSDIGEALGCGGCMKKLLRTAVGPFKIGEAYRLADIEQAVSEERLGEILSSPDCFFPDLPAYHTVAEADRAAYNGNRIYAGELAEEHAPAQAAADEMIKLYDSQGDFIGLFAKEKGAYRPYKMLYDTGETH